MGLRQTLLLIVSIILLYSHQVNTFNPRWLFVGGIDPRYWFTDVSGFGNHWSMYGYPHEGITNEAMESLYGPYFGIKDPTASMLQARKQITDANALVDEGSEKYFPPAPSTAKVLRKARNDWFPFESY